MAAATVTKCVFVYAKVIHNNSVTIYLWNRTKKKTEFRPHKYITTLLTFALITHIYTIFNSMEIFVWLYGRPHIHNEQFFVYLFSILPTSMKWFYFVFFFLLFSYTSHIAIVPFPHHHHHQPDWKPFFPNY